MLEHQHVIIRAEINKPPFDRAQIEQWLTKLVSDLGMKIMIGPISEYPNIVGNRGLTAVVVIETSHIALHVWDEESPSMLQLDVYSCSKVDPKMVINSILEFDPIHVDYTFLDRKGKYITILEKSS